LNNVRSNLKAILDERNISVRKLALEIEYRYETVRQLYNNDTEHYPKALITKICNHLDITPGELIILEKVNPDC
jgi:DNA-binding Xre family transcriptional regulator